MFDLEYQLKMLPKSPGVYIMKNSLGEIIYIGKAKVLRNRVRQYFRKTGLDIKTKMMVSNVTEFEYIVTNTEIESLILEQNMIKEYLPKYNINLKDDKRFPFIKVTINEDFPRVIMTRSTPKDGSKYFGPYTDVASVTETLETLKKIYPVRTCKRIILEGASPQRPCLNYHMGLCSAPCAGYITRAEYGKMIDEIISILSGHEVSLKRQLKEEMEEAAEKLDFEKAAQYRDKYLALEKVQNKQRIYFAQKESDEDYIALYKDETDTCVQVFFLREGKIMGREHFFIKDTLDQKEEYILTEFLESFYGKTAYIPKRICCKAVEDRELLEAFLSLKKGTKVHVEVPIIGEKKRLLELVEKNAEVTLSQFKGKILKDREDNLKTLEELRDLLGLEEVPKRIESFDISNIAGVDSVGSMIVFEDGKAKNSDYRRFKIKGVKGANDYASMKEIIERRFSRGLEESKLIKDRSMDAKLGKFTFFPDLILMDGGRGQVNIALEVLSNLGINIPVAGLVKDDRHRTRGIIYNNEEFNLKGRGSLFNLLTRIQDEVHRFAISYHRSLRKRTQISSKLDEIKGIGEKRRKNLLLKFGSIEEIAKASKEELLEVPSMDNKSADSVINYFKSQGKPV